MPLLAGVLSTLFGAFFAVLAKRLTLGIAAAAAFLAVAAASFAVVKLALFALFAGLSIVIPPNALIGMASFMPTHTTAYVGLLLLANAILISFDYWFINMKVAFQLANAS